MSDETVDPSSEEWLRLRFRDLDAFGHVYHAEFLTLLDEARSRWFAQVGMENPESYVLAHLEIDWLSPLSASDRAVRAAFEVGAVGTSSITARETLYAEDGREVSRSRSVTVRWDRSASRPRAITSDERAALERLLG